MKKKFGVIVLSILFSISVYAQNSPSGGFLPEDVIKRLSYENFKYIKLLTPSIMNFGGGKSQFDGLVSKYAQATSLYFNKENVEAAKMFEENEKDILTAAMELAKSYKERTTEIQKEMIEYNVKISIESELNGKRTPAPADKLMNQAIEANRFASDLFERSRPLQALEYLRISKKKMFQYYEVMKDFDPELEKRYEEDIQKKYEKDMVDNDMQIYDSKEKKN